MIPLRMQLLLILTMASWGLNISVLKFLTQHYDIMVLAAVRIVLASIIINLIFLWSRQPAKLRSITPGQWLRFIACGGCMVYLNQILFVSGMGATSATNAALIMASGPLVAALMAAVIFREALTRKRMAGVALGFVGVAAVVVGGSQGEVAAAGWGDLIILLAITTFITGGLLIQSLARHFNNILITAIIYTIGAVLLLAHTSVMRPGLWSLSALFPSFWPPVLLVFSGVVATALCNLFWNRVISEYGAARTTVYQYWVPLFGVGFAVVLLGDPFSLWHVAGMVGIMLGTWLGAQGAKPAAATSLTIKPASPKR